jgi:gliding motility-associated-like protein
MLKYTYTTLLLLLCYCSNAQIQVADASVPPFTPENLITNYFLGDGIKVKSITYEGSKKAVGLFDKGKNAVGIQRGIAMTSGRVDNDISNLNVKGIANAASVNASTDNSLSASDPDIAKLVKPGQAIRDMAKYTITFIPTSDTLRFRYVFASEEYPEFGCSPFNDVFGFFISGPGINGTFQNNGINIALVPGTNLPVSIDNIHPQNPNNASCKPFNQQYYIANNGIKQPVYDGMTKVFTAEAIVIPCQTYTIKLIIADASDGILDSGVFLEEKSFGTGTLEVKPTSVSLDGTVSEGCSAGTVTFSLPKKAEKDYPVDVKIIGTAQNGIDYKTIPTKISIPLGDSVVVVPIVPIDDNILEGTESIGFDVQIDICERDTFWIYIRENNIKKPVLGNDVTICSGDVLQLDATLPVALPPPSIFESKDSAVINTITPFSPNTPATVTSLDVFGVQPLQLQDGMIESVCVNMRHQWIDDIDCYLVAPNGQFIALTTDNGGSGGNGAGLDYYNNTCFSPDAKQSITTGTVPFTGSFQPEDPWSDLWSVKDNPVNGKWSLQLIDDQTGAQGKILDWKITFKPYYQIKYKWSPTDGLSCSDCPNPTAAPTKTTTYIVEATDNYGCPVSDTITVFVKDSIEAPTILCNIVTHNTIQFAWSPVLFAEGYEISIDNGPWIKPDFLTSHKLSNLGLTTTKNIRVRGTGSCGGKIGYGSCTTLNCQSPTPTIDVAKNISCNGKNDGSIQLSASGGLPPYTFKLDNGVSNTTGIFNGLKQGNYVVSITESATCTAVVNIKINEPSPLKFAYAADSVTCFGGDDAAAALDIKGGTTPYTYQWSNGETKDVVFNLKKLNYLVTVTDANNCTIIDSVKVFEPKQITFKKEVTDIKCYSDVDGSARVIPSNGTLPYTYNWNTNQGLQITQKAINLAAGEHFLTITDDKGCAVKTSVIINAASLITIKKQSQNILCFGENNGKASINLSGGTPPYQYAWNDATKSKDTIITKLSPGKYIVTITDKAGCVQSDSVTITQPTKLTTNLVFTNPKCYGIAEGEAEITANGGTLPYFYAWSNGKNNITKVTQLEGDKTYYLTVQDVSKCTVIDTFKITYLDSLAISNTVTPATCNGATNGAIDITVLGGTGTYTYDWTDGKSFSAATKNINNLKSGIYTLKVTDSNNCEKIVSFDITEPNTVKANAAVTDVKCKNDNSGAINLTIQGGTLPYKYVWNNSDTLKDIKNLLAGKYAVTISDAKGCNYPFDFEVKEPVESLSATFNVADTLCFGKTGQIVASAKGGTLPHQYKWQTGATANILPNVLAGNYILTITDANQCVWQDTAKLYGLEQVNLTLSQKTASCYLSSDGEANIVAISYGNKAANTNQFSYSWDNSNAATTTTVSNLVGGKTYSVTATDKRGCRGNASITIDNPAAIEIFEKEKTIPKCFGDANGTISVDGAGGTKPYQFLWDKNANNQTAAIAKDLLSGTYEVTIQDDKGCKNTAKFSLNNPEKLKITLTTKNLDCPQNNSGAASASGSGGATPYSYFWSNKENTNIINNLSAGKYGLTLTDANGCIIDTTANITQPPPLSLQITTTDVDCAGSKDGSLDINVVGGTSPFFFSVNGNNFSTKSQYTSLRANVYDVVVKDKNGCLFDEQVIINEPFPIAIDLGRDTSVNYGDSIQLLPVVKDAVGKVTYQWTPFAPDLLSCETCEKPFASPTNTTFFTLSVKDEKLCTATQMIKVSVNSRFVLLVPTGFTPNDDDKNDRLITHGENATKVLYFTVYDKWGEKVFEQENMPINDEKTGWDGTFRGKKMSSGVYTWYAKVQFITGDIKNFSGTTTLLQE